MYINSIFLGVSISLVVLLSANNHMHEIFERIYSAYAIILEIIVSVSLACLGQKFYNLSGDAPSRTLLPSSPFSFVLVNWVVVVMFTLRAVVTSVVAFSDTHLPSDGQLIYIGPEGNTALAPFFFFLLTEIIPCFCVKWLLSSDYNLRYSTYCYFVLSFCLKGKDDPSDDITRFSWLSKDNIDRQGTVSKEGDNTVLVRHLLNSSVSCLESPPTGLLSDGNRKLISPHVGRKSEDENMDQARDCGSLSSDDNIHLSSWVSNQNQTLPSNPLSAPPSSSVTSTSLSLDTPYVSPYATSYANKGNSYGPNNVQKLNYNGVRGSLSSSSMTSSSQSFNISQAQSQPPQRQMFGVRSSHPSLGNEDWADQVSVVHSAPVPPPNPPLRSTSDWTESSQESPTTAHKYLVKFEAPDLSTGAASSGLSASEGQSEISSMLPANAPITFAFGQQSTRPPSGRLVRPSPLVVYGREDSDEA